MGKLVKQLGSIEKHLSKNGILELAKDNAQSVIDAGHYDVLKVYVELKRYETYLKGLIDNLKQPAFDKALDKGQKSFDFDDARVHISARTKWNYSVDTKWSELEQQIQQLTKEKKDRENYLKENNQIRTIVDKATGEVIEEFELPKEIEYGIVVRL